MTFTLDIVIRTTAVLFCGAIMAALLRRASASTRHAVWALTLLAALVVPLLSRILPSLEIPLAALTASGPGQLAGPQAENILAISDFGFRAWRTGSNPALVESESRNPKSEIAANPSWRTLNWIGLSWAAGFVVVFARMLMGAWTVRRLARNAKPATDASWKEMLNSLRSQFSIRKPVQVVISDASITPMTWGIRRTVILFPGRASEWTEQRRRHVLLHELAHVKRNDGVLQILTHFVCSLYWFNPAVWFAAYRLRIERERACDDQVLNMGARPDEYAEHLLQVARSVRPATALSLAAVSMAHRSQLETRLLGILDSGARRQNLPRAAAGLLILGILAVTLPVATLRLTAQPGAPQTNQSTSAGSREKAQAQPQAQPEPPRSSQSVTSLTAEQLYERINELQRQFEELIRQAPQVQPQVEDQMWRRLAEMEARESIMADERARIEALTEIERARANELGLTTPKLQELERRRAAIEAASEQSNAARLTQELAEWESRMRVDEPRWREALERESLAIAQAVKQLHGVQISPEQLERVLQPLMEALKDESEDVRTEAIDAIRHLGSFPDSRMFESVMTAMLNAMKDKSEDVRSAAAQALGMLGDSRAIDVLTAALKDQSSDVRRAAVRALSQIIRRD